MLFTRYNLFKNHGDFVHLNMLKWALKYVPEFGKKTVPDDETVKSMEIGTGGVDINTVKDGTGEEKSKHVPYTDVQLNGKSRATVQFKADLHNEIRYADFDGSRMAFDRYTKVLDPGGLNNPNNANMYAGISLYDRDTVNVDGTNHNYVTKIKYLNKDSDGTLTDANQDKEFRPYTSVLRDDDSLASQMKVKHDEDNHLTGVSFPVTGESYDVEATHISVNNIRDDDVNPPVSKEYKKYTLQLDFNVVSKEGIRYQKIKGIDIGDVNDGFHIDLSGLNIMAERYKDSIIS